MLADIRTETPDDQAVVRGLLLDAFDDDIPARLVELLRTSAVDRPELSFVAVSDDRVVGYVKLSDVELHGDRRFVALNLTPLAVATDSQGRGIGRSLVEHALHAAENVSSDPLVILEGDPRHYHRYGFRRASAAGIERPSPTIPDAAFQFIALSRYDPSVHSGRVAYPAPFHELGLLGTDTAAASSAPAPDRA